MDGYDCRVWRVARRFIAAQDPKKPKPSKQYRGKTGSKHFTVTSKITNREEIKPFRDAALKAAKYGGEPHEWTKWKGKASVRYDDGETQSSAEVHWIERVGVGRFEFKVKR